MGEGVSLGNPSIEGVLKKNFLETVRPRAEKIVKSYRIEEKNFTSYNPEQVERDVEVGLEKKAVRESSEGELLANVAIAIILEQIGTRKWFGEGALAIKTSNYDEGQGIRLLIEFQRKDGTSWLALATDIVFADGLWRKSERTKERIKEGKWGSIKYFHSERSGITGKLDYLPEAAIAVESKKALIELGQLYFFEKDQKDESAIRELEIRLARFYQQMLGGLRAQLKEFSSCADEGVRQAQQKREPDLGARRVVAGAYKRALDMVERAVQNNGK